MADEEELPFLLDLSQLNLKISASEVVDSVGDFMSGSISAKGEKNKLVKVTLTGSLPSPSKITLKSNDFMAISEIKGSTFVMGKNSVAIHINGIWTLESSKENTFGVTTVLLREAGPITIKVAFILPQDVNEFFVSYPALVSGKVNLSGAHK
jgi:hypothetical protein